MQNMRLTWITLIVLMIWSVAGVSGLFSGRLIADDQRPCRNTNWSPDRWQSLDVVSRSDAQAVSRQWFQWSPSRLANFKKLGANYQFEIRRMAEVWDWWRVEGLNCVGTWWSNLPGATPKYSEESDLPCSLARNEEFQINATQSRNLQANTWYGCYAWFWRDSEDKGKSFHVHSESEYCKGPLPLCNFGRGFDWCMMTSRDETA